ncbi:MAG TPA: NmrA family NAD(P)-binding protein [Polyangia bacterium]|nr:NmrA family NAD(P)-binding protein [Polyangia bacterium]
MYVVAGVTGNTGSVVASELLARGAAVRVIVRSESKGASWKARGAEVAVASVEDAEALARALDGAQGAYLLLPPDASATDFIASRKRLAQTLAQAVERAQIPHVVFLSSIAAHLPGGTGPIESVHHGERILGALKGRTTFLRAAYFLDNWAAVLPVAEKDGALPSFVPADLRIPMVSTRDIGRTAARALLAPPERTQVIELAGPEDVRPADIAAQLGRLFGREVKVQAYPPQAAATAFTSFGFSSHMAQLYAEMYEAIAAGRCVFERPAQVTRDEIPLGDALRQLLGR